MTAASPSTAPSSSAPGPLRRWASRETTGGALLIGAALVALLWANSPWRDAYFTLSNAVLGPSAPLHLDLTLATWAADGLCLLSGRTALQSCSSGPTRGSRLPG